MSIEGLLVSTTTSKEVFKMPDHPPKAWAVWLCDYGFYVPIVLALILLWSAFGAKGLLIPVAATFIAVFSKGSE